MIGLALVTCVAVLTDSVRVSTNDAIEGAFRADFIVFTQGPDFNTQAAQALQQDPSLRDVTEVRGTSVLNGRMYQLRYSLDNGATWMDAGTKYTSARRMLLTPTTPGKIHTIEICALGGSTGQSAWSLPVSIMST